MTAVTLAEFLAMSLWFSATAIVPALMDFWQVSVGQAAWLTMAVQLGFVAGAATLALLNVADRLEPRAVMAGGAVVGGLANLAIPLLEPGFLAAVGFRAATGFALAAVYPVGMKIVASWSRGDRGLLIGILVGALTLGSASPHLVNGIGGVGDWHAVMYATSILALSAAGIALVFGHMGPDRPPRSPFDWRQVGAAFSNRSLRLANFGYLGHMWELYAMWTWIPTFLFVAFSQGGDATSGSPARAASLASFAVIGIGGLGSVAAGRLADRWGRGKTTILALSVSGSCCLLAGLLFPYPSWPLVVLCLVWGATVVADSAQFSAGVSELADPRYVGTQLTTQTAVGFLLTIVSIQLVPIAAGVVGWRWAFVFLALGPAVGSVAMRALGRSSDAGKLAGGLG